MSKSFKYWRSPAANYGRCNKYVYSLIRKDKYGKCQINRTTVPGICTVCVQYRYMGKAVWKVPNNIPVQYYVVCRQAQASSSTDDGRLTPQSVRTVRDTTTQNTDYSLDIRHWETKRSEKQWAVFAFASSFRFYETRDVSFLLPPS